MRILLVSAFYPPYSIGGWEQLARDINQRLQARGHVTHVLTSRHGLASQNGNDEAGVERALELESDLYHYRLRDFTSYASRLQHNEDVVRRTVAQFGPDVVFVHVMFNLSHAVPRLLEELLPGRVVYYIANDWPYASDAHTAYWRAPATSWWSNAGKRIVAPIAISWLSRKNKAWRLDFEHVLCVSQAVRRELIARASIAPEAVKVVYNGVETDKFVPAPSRNSSLSLLYAGSIVEHKGVHTALEALAHLLQQNKLRDMTLTIVGAGHPDYEARLKRMTERTGLSEHVHFHGRVPRQQMPEILSKADVLLVPSVWEEPLSRMMQEGMAAGLVVVGTLTGGSGELLVEGETGLAFPPGDAIRLAERLQELQASPDLCTKLAKNARETVVERFDIRRMVDEIEAYLTEVDGTAQRAVVKNSER